MNNDPLSAEEIARLRLILLQDERVDWLYANIRKWGAGILAIIAAAVAFRNDIASLFAWLFQGPRP